MASKSKRTIRQAGSHFRKESASVVTLERGDEIACFAFERDLWHNDFALTPTATIRR